MRTPQRLTWCAAILLLAGCGTPADMTSSTNESSPPQTSTRGSTTSAAPDPSQDPEPSTVEPSSNEPPPSDVTVVATVQLAEDPLAPVGDDLDRLVKAWVSYAMGDAVTFPHWESLSMASVGRASWRLMTWLPRYPTETSGSSARPTGTCTARHHAPWTSWARSAHQW